MEQKQRVLIVDDSDMNQELLTEMLANHYDIFVAANGNEAISELSQNGATYSIILLDVVMPEADGYAVLNAMNKLGIISDIPVVMITAENNPDSIKRCYDLGAIGYITKPFDLQYVLYTIRTTIMLYAKQKRLMELITEQVRERVKNSDLLIGILSHIVEFRNGESGMHVIHIRRITEKLLTTLVHKTDRYNLNSSDIVRICNASALHDIGKISIPDEILNKPGRLTEEEFSVMKKHSAVGGDLISQLTQYKADPLIQTAYEICRWHHERYDGKGYPEGLVGDDIPISAQIVAVADVYDALTSERVYKKAYSHEQAIEMITHGECGAFSPLLMECLLESAADLKQMLQDPTPDSDIKSEVEEDSVSSVTKELIDNADLLSTDSATEQLVLATKKMAFLEALCPDILIEYAVDTKHLHLSGQGLSAFGIDNHQFTSLNGEGLLRFINHTSLDEIVNLVKQASEGNPQFTYQCYANTESKAVLYHFDFLTLWSTGETPAVNRIIGRATCGAKRT